MNLSQGKKDFYPQFLLMFPRLAPPPPDHSIVWNFLYTRQRFHGAWFKSEESGRRTRAQERDIDLRVGRGLSVSKSGHWSSFSVVVVKEQGKKSTCDYGTNHQRLLFKVRQEEFRSICQEVAPEVSFTLEPPHISQHERKTSETAIQEKGQPEKKRLRSCCVTLFLLSRVCSPQIENQWQTKFH